MEGERTFFVVEDHTLTNRGIRELIQEQGGYSCIGYAFSKSESLEKLTELSKEGKLPDILILDLFLGDESGLDILREVKANLPSVKVIVYSMFAKPGIVSLALEGSPLKNLILFFQKTKIRQKNSLYLIFFPDYNLL